MPLDGCEVRSTGEKNFMPFWEGQKMKFPKVCNELIMIELNSSTIWTYGTKAWGDTNSAENNQLLLRLFMFLIDRACTCNAVIYIETLVEHTDHTELRNNFIDSKSLVVGYRLWIPLDTDSVNVFNKTVAAAVSTEAMRQAAEASGTDFTFRAKKRHRVAEPEPILALRPVENIHDLLRLIRLYYIGKIEIKGIKFQSTGESAAPAQDGNAQNVQDDEAVEDNGNDSSDDDMDVPVQHETFTRLLSAQKQFQFEPFVKRSQDTNMFDCQQRYESYVRVRRQDGLPVFWPKNRIKNSGLLREIQCGAGSSMLRNARDLFDYLRCEFRPDAAAVASQIKHVSQPSGIYPDLTGMAVEDMIDMTNSDHAGVKFKDPHGYSYITINDEHAFEDSAETIYVEAMQNVYHHTSALQIKHKERLRMAAARGDPDLVERHYAQIVRDTTLLYEEKNVPGVPPMYPKLTSSAERRLMKLRTPTDDPMINEAKKLFWADVLPGSGMGLCKFLTTNAVRSRNMLNLLPQQLPIVTFLYQRHFSLTWNRMCESFLGTLCGPPDTGKTESCKRASSIVAPELVWANDGSSNLAITVQSEKDMTFHFIEELKNTGKDGKDSESGTSTKLWQSQISNGVIRYETKVVNTQTGKWGLQTSLVVLRSCTVTNTNVPEGIPPALRSRQTEFDVVRMPHGDGVRNYWNGNTAIAIRDNRSQKKYSNAWSFCLRTYSTLAIKWTGIEAVGAIPDVDSTNFIIFEMMHQKLLPHNLPPRRTLAIKQFAEAIMIMDVISMWYTRGLGKKYNFDATIEAMFYACSAYLAPHHIVAAYTQLEQTTSKSESITQMLSSLKEFLLFDGNEPVLSDDYYVCSHVQMDVLCNEIVKLMPRQGKGIVTRLFREIEQGVTGGMSNMKMGQHNGMQRIMLNRKLMASVLSLTEIQILKVLYRLSNTKGKCLRGYDDERNIRVFRSSVVTSFRNLAGDQSIDMPELAMYKSQPQRINQALSLLEDVTDEDGMPMFKMPTKFMVAKYVPIDEEDSVPSHATRKWNKVKSEQPVPLVVHVDLLKKLSSTRDRSIDDFLVKFLSVTDSRYIDGPLVFAGLNTGNASTMEHTIKVPLDIDTVVEIYNPFYVSKGTAIALYGKRGMHMYDGVEPSMVPKGVPSGPETPSASTEIEDNMMEEEHASDDKAFQSIDVTTMCSDTEERKRRREGKKPMGSSLLGATVSAAAAAAAARESLEDDEVADPIQNDVFPMTKRFVKLTCKSNVTQKIAWHYAQKVVCVPEKYHETFCNAHFNY